MQPQPPQQGPPPQQPYTLPPPYYPPYPPYGAPPKRPSIERIILLVAIAVIVVIVVAAFAIPLAQKAVASPSITASNATYIESGCNYGPPSVTFHLTLTNTGDADGVATVKFYAEQSALGTDQWTVPQHNSINEYADFSLSSCGHSYTYAIVSVQKA